MDFYIVHGFVVEEGPQKDAGGNDSDDTDENVDLPSAMSLSVRKFLIAERDLEPATFPGEGDAIPRSLVEKFDAFDFQCGRYFEKRTEDGTQYIPNAALRARSHHG